jgi:hypothetical protein
MASAQLVMKWDPADVVNFLDYIRLQLDKASFPVKTDCFEHIKTSFLLNGVDGQLLLELTNDELREDLNVNVFSHRKYILKYIQRLNDEPDLVGIIESRTHMHTADQHSASVVFHFFVEAYQALMPLCSYEDVQGLLETLLFQTALLLAFAMNAFSNLDHDNLLSSDQRYLNMQIQPYFRVNWPYFSADMIAAYNIGDPSQIINSGADSLLSKRYFDATFSAISILTCVLVMGTVLYIGLACSNARSNEEHLRTWMCVFFPFVLLGYCTLVSGIYHLFNAYHQFVDMVFPLYNFTNFTVMNQDNGLRTIQMLETGWSFGLSAQHRVRDTNSYVLAVIGLVFSLHALLGCKQMYWARGRGVEVARSATQPTPPNSESGTDA